MGKHIAVAIDGPSGAGKSSIARSAAQELGFVYVDTGAIYRTVSLYIFDRGIDPADRAAVTAALPEIHIDLRYGDGGLQRMFLNGEDVTERIRLPEISMFTSAVSGIPEVRAFLMEMQRSLARERSVIMDGRDIGTVVLPEAQVKIFLTASPEDRARRRWEELRERGTEKTYEDILREVEERDYNDTHRAAAPLRPAEDAVCLDTTGCTFRQSRERILAIIRRHMEA
ncbi:MAG: (d)CMP kinase [Oscillospiraceae bacterium]|jgi:cytidylate kinase|nr:(d)CMP kinase [Oscillospiraceae bacterium]